jgi:hypothetical protein
LNYLGWHGIQLDYHTLQLAIACLENEGLENMENESPRRKRTGYQSGLKSDLYLGGHVVSPQNPIPRIYPTPRGWGI